MSIRAVVFDVGETLVDETRLWNGWADWMGLSPAEFYAQLTAVIRQRKHHRQVFEVLRPGFDADAEQARRADTGMAYTLTLDDFYPDALPCLQALHGAGYRVGIAGNQPADAEAILAASGLPVDMVAGSATWGVEKPDPRFFTRIVEALASTPAEVVYVGDRLDNDVLPATAAGMIAVHIMRGPWAPVHAEWPEAVKVRHTIHDLACLPGLLGKWRAGLELSARSRS